ncbi:ubiquitin-associated domain-containing protein 2 isoform X1 [Centrocercus urophasianus]|uniref:ubiquitin-associated domain-containing protein 2 isoform X1 n=1 Tax=Centrocercus urophasianus TaxID=9002 RepID=UPI001C64FB9E|nr:ubiquitin-associated domain-containing protein 2 isoform X1 [Centrocercus urophasianus]
MFTSTGSNGLYKAPLSKSLLLVPSAISILLTLLFQHYQKFFVYNLQAIKEDFQIWRLVCGRVICLDLKDTFCSSLLIYNFRIFERRYGSRKFSSFLLGAWTLSALFDLLLIEAAQYVFGITINSLPSGFARSIVSMTEKWLTVHKLAPYLFLFNKPVNEISLGPVFALFVPFYCSIPRVQVTQVLGFFSITNKTLVYILGLQLLTSGSYIWILALSGLISGICYNSSILKVHRILCVPSWVAKIFSWTLEPIFSSAEPTNEIRVGMGATVDIQRQQRMELLDRQIMMSQVAQMRRQRQQQGGMINWNRLFPPLRHRHNENYQDHHPSEQDTPPPTEVSEEQVARLMEMGFSRGDALEALRASNNDLNVATNFLLQH